MNMVSITMFQLDFKVSLSSGLRNILLDLVLATNIFWSLL